MHRIFFRTIKTKGYNVMIDRENIFDQSVKNDLRNTFLCFHLVLLQVCVVNADIHNRIWFLTLSCVSLSAL